MSLDPYRRRLLTQPRKGAKSQRRWAGELFHTTLDLLYPPHCVCCNAPLPPESNKALCLACAEKILWIGSDCCARCGDGVGQGSGVVKDCPSCRAHPPAYIHSSCAVGKYAEGPLRQLILSLKFGGKIHVAEVLGALLAARVENTGMRGDDMVVVPAPLTRDAEYQRGYNQAEEIAETVAAKLSLRIERRLLKKIRATPTQATLSPQKRRENVKGAFACAPKVAALLSGAKVLLIDDVITTGSTISECARTLRESGIEQVQAAAVARG